jgi:hypothetical protein
MPAWFWELDDIGVIEIIQENPYMQYFLGLKGFTENPVFDPSLLVHIRKRIDLNVFESLTDELIRKGLKIKQTPEKESKDDEPTPSGGTKNKGKLQLDATVADLFVMNLIRYTRDFSGSLLKWFFANVMKMREEIILTFMPAQRNLGLI